MFVIFLFHVVMFFASFSTFTCCCFNLAVKFSAFSLLNSTIVIYLLWPVTLFSTAVRAVLAAKLAILGIFLTFFILALRVALVAKLVISGILPSIFLILALYIYIYIYISSLAASFFTASLGLLKSAGAGANLSTSYLSTLLFKLLNPFLPTVPYMGHFKKMHILRVGKR